MGLFYGFVLVYMYDIFIYLQFFFFFKIRGDKCLVIDPKLSGSLSLLVQSSELKVFRVLVITHFCLILSSLILVASFKMVNC